MEQELTNKKANLFYDFYRLQIAHDRRFIALNTVTNLAKAPIIWSWKYQDLADFHKMYADQIREYDRIRKSVGLEITDLKMDINKPDLENIFIMRFQRDLKKSISYLKVVENEIKRRRELIGATA